MSRAQRVKDALASTLAKCRADIDEIHKAGKHAALYSVGFTNGLIMADHHINMRGGEPKFYDVTSSVTSLPKPQQLKTVEEEAAETEYEYLVDKVLTASRTVLSLAENDETTHEQGSSAIEDLKEGFRALDAFIEEQVTMEEAGQGEVASTSDASAGDQAGASPAPAPLDFSDADHDSVPCP